MVKTLQEVKDEILVAMSSCARSVAQTTRVETALQCADAVEKLARGLSYLEHIKEREDN